MKTVVFGVFAAGSLFVSSPLFADDKEESVDQILVTGARTPVDVNRLGSAWTVIEREEIELRQARYVTDLLRSVPGFAVSQSGVAGTQTQLRVRGSEANHVLVLIDGVRANDPASGDDFKWEFLSAGNIERVEIVRGPQSALWGSDAVGAVVHIVTRNLSGATGGNAFVESGSNSSLNIGANGTLSTGDWTFGGGIESFDTDGENISRSGDEEDGSDLTTGSVSASYNGGDTFTFNAGLRVVDGTSQFDGISFLTSLPADSDNETQTDNVVANVGGSWLAHNDRVRYHATAQFFDADNTNFVNGLEDSSTNSERQTLVLQADIELGENLLSLALEQEDTDYSYRGAVVFGDPNQDQSMDVTSAIAEYQFLASDQLTWILGARFDSHSDFEDALTGKASLAYQLNSDTRLRASIGTAHKAPTFTELFGFFPAQFAGNPDLEPETSISYDLGIDQQFLDGALSLQASLYWQELEDEINGFVFDPVTFLTTAENRPGKSDRSGIELAASWAINDNFSASATYTYTDSEEENALGENVAEIRRPEHTGGLSLGYNSDDNRISTSLSADYGGSRLDSFFDPVTFTPEAVTLDSFWLVDLTAQYRVTSSVSVFVRGANLLDEEYEEVLGYRNLGRTAYVGLRASFGR